RNVRQEDRQRFGISRHAFAAGETDLADASVGPGDQDDAMEHARAGRGYYENLLPGVIEITKSRKMLQEAIENIQEEFSEDTGHNEAEQVNADHGEDHTKARKAQAEHVRQRPGVSLNPDGPHDYNDQRHGRQETGPKLVAQMT